MKKLLLLFTFCLTSLFAERGIVVTCNDKYATWLIPSIYHLRYQLHCELPIEVWHAGSELSEETKAKLELFNDVCVKDLMKKRDGREEDYWDWHIKPLAMEASYFDEVLLMDADVFFLQDPEILFKSREYKKTGTYFFRDRKKYYFPAGFWPIKRKSVYHAFTVDFFLDQRAYILERVPRPSPYIPPEWKHIWNTDFIPSKSERVNSEYQEAGCVVLDKRRHKKGLSSIVYLNLNHEETYKHFYGDKETYWFGLEMSREPYYINPEYPLTLMGKNRQTITLVQFYKDKPFYQQKSAIELGDDPHFLEENQRVREVSEEDQRALNLVLYAESTLKNHRYLLKP